MKYREMLKEYYHPHLTQEEIKRIESLSKDRAWGLYRKSFMHFFNHHELEEANQTIRKGLPQNLDDVLMGLTGDHFAPTGRLDAKVASTKRTKIFPSLYNLMSYFTQLNTYKAVYYKTVQ